MKEDETFDVLYIDVFSLDAQFCAGVRLRKQFGAGRWRKLKGIATVRLANGRIRRVELHWYEAHGIGKKKLKIKHYLD